MERRTRAFPLGSCLRCKVPILVRPDGLPLCSDCEKRLTEKAAKLLPKLSAKGKLELVSDAEIKTGKIPG